MLQYKPVMKLLILLLTPNETHIHIKKNIYFVTVMSKALH